MWNIQPYNLTILTYPLLSTGQLKVKMTLQISIQQCKYSNTYEIDPNESITTATEICLAKATG